MFFSKVKGNKVKKKIKEVPELFNEKYLYLDNSNFFTRGRVRVLTYADQKVKKLRLKDLKKYGVNLIYGSKFRHN